MRRVVALVTGYGKLQNRRRLLGFMEIAEFLNELGGPFEAKQFAWNEIAEIEAFIATADEAIGVGHSYGASTVAKIAERNPSTRFSHVVFSDCVWRKELCAPSIQSVRPGKITLTDNVENFHNFYREKGILQGGKTTILLAPNTNYVTKVKVSRRWHQTMDRLPELKELVMRLAS